MTLSERLGTKSDAVLTAKDKAILRLAAMIVALKRTQSGIVFTPEGAFQQMPSRALLDAALHDVMEKPLEYNHNINYAEDTLDWFIKG
jgi:hypothetical protein